MWNCINRYENEGARAFLKNKTMADNPYDTAYFYKEWANGFRKAKEWDIDLKNYIIKVYNINPL